MWWHCQSEVTGEYFCEQCVKVQPLSKAHDYFTCLGLPRLLNIDIGTLEAKFYELSRAFHPDFYQNKTDSEQAISMGNSALLNTAYRTLKDPIQRAEYLLRLEAGSEKKKKKKTPTKKKKKKKKQKKKQKKNKNTTTTTQHTHTHTHTHTHARTHARK